MEYWCHSKLRISINGDVGNELLTDRPLAIVGSHPQSDVLLTTSGATKRVALIYVDANTQKVASRSLIPGETHESRLDSDALELRIGAHRIIAYPLPSIDEYKDHPAPHRIPVLKVSRKQRKAVRRRLFHDLAFVGRDKECEIALQFEGVSAFHCALYRCGTRLWCIDLCSSNGTFLNGVRIDRCAEVKLGDRLTIEHVELCFYRYSRQKITSPDSHSDHEEVAEASAIHEEDLRQEPLESAEIADEPILEHDAMKRDPLSGTSNSAIAEPQPTVHQMRSEVDRLREESLALRNERDRLAATVAELSARPDLPDSTFATATSPLLEEEQTGLIVAKPNSRRRRATKDMVDDDVAPLHFVSDRLVERDAIKRRRLLITWTVVLLTISITGAGLAWLFRDTLANLSFG